MGIDLQFENLFLENYCGGDLYSLFIRNDSLDEISSKIF